MLAKMFTQFTAGNLSLRATATIFRVCETTVRHRLDRAPQSGFPLRQPRKTSSTLKSRILVCTMHAVPHRNPNAPRSYKPSPANGPVLAL